MTAQIVGDDEKVADRVVGLDVLLSFLSITNEE